MSPRNGYDFARSSSSMTMLRHTKGYVRLTTLNASHICSVNSATLGQFFLRYFLFHAQRAHAPAELTRYEIRH